MVLGTINDLSSTLLWHCSLSVLSGCCELCSFTLSSPLTICLCLEANWPSTEFPNPSAKLNLSSLKLWVLVFGVLWVQQKKNDVSRALPLYFPAEVHERSSSSSTSSRILGMAYFSNFNHSNKCEVVFRTGFDLHFLNTLCTYYVLSKLSFVKYLLRPLFLSLLMDFF